MHALEALYFKGLCIFCDKSAKFTKRLRKKNFYIYVLYRKFLHFCHTGKERRDFYAEVNQTEHRQKSDEGCRDRQGESQDEYPAEPDGRAEQDQDCQDEQDGSGTPEACGDIPEESADVEECADRRVPEGSGQGFHQEESGT